MAMLTLIYVKIREHNCFTEQRQPVITVYSSFANRNLSALVITLTDDIAIAPRR